MITINLLPVASFKQQFQGRTFLTGYGIFMVLAVAGLFGVKTGLLDRTLENLGNERTRVTNSLNDVKKRVDEATAVSNATVTRWKQLAAIMELEERRRDQTRLLVEVEELLPKTNAWLVGLNHQGGALSLEGISTDKETISQFLTRLENAIYIDRASVELVQISQDLIINGIRLTRFSVKARTNFPQPGILSTGLPDYGLPSQEEFMKAVKIVDEKLAESLTEQPDQGTTRRRL